MDFFTEEDVRLLGEYGNQVHRGTQQAKKIERDLSAGAWAKTKEWGNLLATDDFKVECRRSVVKQAGLLPKQADGRRRMKRVYRPYSWAKLFRPGEEAYKIFFTVGVDGPGQELVWKLDCMREGSKGLDQRLVIRFDEYMKRNAPAARWKTIQIGALGRWDWGRLLETTRQFIEQNAHHYDAALAYAWQEQEPDRNKLARICWNTLGWQQPSGPVGKSTSADSHESSQFAGFGAEEWLFNYTRLIDGYHYAFLQPLNSGINGAAYAGRDFNIRLFTRNEGTGKYYHVGRILNAHVLTEEERQAAEAVYRRKGWRDDMQLELSEVGSTVTITMGEEGPGPFNVRFRPIDVERPDTPDGLELVDDIDELTKSKRYKLFKDIGYNGGPHKTDAGTEVEVIMKERRSTNGKLQQRQVQAAQIELAGLHDKVQAQLLKQLKKQYPEQDISKEALIKPYGTRIDVVRKQLDGSMVFYEIKVLPTIKACIREALGQLLEYAHWSIKELSREWVIVSFHPTNSEVEEYLDRLRVLYHLPIKYWQIELE